VGREDRACLATLPPQVLTVVRDVDGQATADLFLVGAPIDLLGRDRCPVHQGKPLHTLSGDERRAPEEVLTLPAAHT
jgi:hypothetical protein